jgi:hypothetical protein
VSVKINESGQLTGLDSLWAELINPPPEQLLKEFDDININIPIKP